ncbi:hypothetical protein [Peribacillus muralis]|uniref:hypothetical protein n=1 Tax=Peribacillus muralis TaxID=264697 RepID=UPI003CFC1545
MENYNFLSKEKAQNGISYVFGHFINNKEGKKIINTYIRNFKSKGFPKKLNPIIAVSVICSETSREIEDIALSNLLWGINIAKGEKEIPSMKKVKKKYSIKKKILSKKEKSK